MLLYYRIRPNKGPGRLKNEKVLIRRSYCKPLQFCVVLSLFMPGQLKSRLQNGGRALIGTRALIGSNTVCISFEGDLDEDGQEVIVAEGGRGGSNQNSFLGQRGEARSVLLDLKLIADVSLVGFPNAGKSTTLSALSRTSPKIASYPFTTIQPYIGTMEYPDTRQITIADLPGLIEGAHINKGMGHKFLKHIERTKLLLFIVDINGFQLHSRYTHRTAFETVLLLNKELELYNREVLDKPAILALNKIDLDEDKEKTTDVIMKVKKLPESLNTVDPEFHPERLIKFDGILTMSAKNADSVEMVKELIRKRLDYHHEKARRIREQQGLVLPEHSKGLQDRLRLKNEQSKSRLL